MPNPYDEFSSEVPAGGSDPYAAFSSPVDGQDSKPSALSSFTSQLPGRILTAVQGPTFGFGDEIQAGIAAPLIVGAKDIGRALGYTSDNPTIGQAYDFALNQARQPIKQEEADHPYESVGLQLAASLPTGGLGAATDVLSGLRSLRGLASEAQGAGEASANVLQALKSIGSGATKAGVTGAAYGFGAGEGGPMARLDSAARVGGFGALVGGAGGAVPYAASALGKIPAVQKGADIVASAGQALDQSLGKTVRPTAAQLKTAAQDNYALADASGAAFKPQVTNDIIAKAESFGPQDAMVAATSKPTLANGLASDWAQFKDQPMTLQRAIAVDQHLTSLLDHADATDKRGILSAQGREIVQVRQQLRDHMDSAVDNGLVEGDPAGIQAYRTATKDWAAQRQVQEIQNIVDKAGYTDNPATALKTGFRAIAANPSRLNQYPKNVQPFIKQAASDGNITNILRSELGSRLLSSMAGGAVGAAGGGPIGAGVGFGVGLMGSRAARAGAETMQMGRVNKVVDAIAANSSLPTTNVPLTAQLQAAFEARKALR